jgi:hypothetical protein
VRFVNQRGEFCAEERYTGFGYNRPAPTDMPTATSRKESK